MERVWVWEREREKVGDVISIESIEGRSCMNTTLIPLPTPIIKSQISWLLTNQDPIFLISYCPLINEKKILRLETNLEPFFFFF